VKLTVHAFKDGAECVRATFVTVTTSLVDHKSIALPDDMRLALKNYQANCDASASLASTSLRYGPSSLPA
jgi:4-hydroxybenzoyl-CoA thioesterase/acyl-CoA thioester hydrolase